MNLPVTTKQLYPKRATREYWDFLLGISTGDRDQHGNFILRRGLTPSETASLRDRARDLAPFLEPGKKTEIARLVVEMILGFGQGSVPRAEAQAVAVQYVKNLSDMPLWCIARACNKFAMGEVTEADLGKGNKWNIGNKPSTAQLRIVAHSIVKPWAEESTRIFMTMRGTAAPPTDPAERARIGTKMTALAEELQKNHEAQRLIETEEERHRRNESRQRAYQTILAEYRHRGIKPVYSDGDKTIPVAIGTLISLGWEIQDHPEGGEKILVAPPLQPAPKGREHYDRT